MAIKEKNNDLGDERTFEKAETYKQRVGNKVSNLGSTLRNWFADWFLIVDYSGPNLSLENILSRFDYSSLLWSACQLSLNALIQAGSP